METKTFMILLVVLATVLILVLLWQATARVRIANKLCLLYKQGGIYALKEVCRVFNFPGTLQSLESSGSPKRASVHMEVRGESETLQILSYSWLNFTPKETLLKTMYGFGAKEYQREYVYVVAEIDSRSLQTGESRNLLIDLY